MVNFDHMSSETTRRMDGNSCHEHVRRLQTVNPFSLFALYHKKKTLQIRIVLKGNYHVQCLSTNKQSICSSFNLPALPRRRHLRFLLFLLHRPQGHTIHFECQCTSKSKYSLQAEKSRIRLRPIQRLSRYVLLFTSRLYFTSVVVLT